MSTLVKLTNLVLNAEPERILLFKAALKGREVTTINIREALDIAKTANDPGAEIEWFEQELEPIHEMSKMWAMIKYFGV